VTRIAIELRTTFRSLRARNFRLYLAGLAVSATGTWIHIVASAWLVLRLTGSGVALGLEMTFAFAPILLFGAWGGVVADRFDKRRVLLATQSVLAALSATLGALTAAGVVRVWMIYAISFAVGLATAVDHPTRQSFVPEMVGTRAVSNAVSLNSAVFTGTRVVGPAIGAAIIAAVGIAPGFFVDAASYLAVVASLAVMRAGELHPAERPAGAGGLRAGLRYAWRARELRLPLLLMAVLFSFSFNFVVILPLLARRAFEGGPATYGGLLSVMGAGSFAAALVLARRPSPSVRLLGLAGVGVGVFGVAAALAPSLAWEWGALIGLGFAAIAFMITGNTTLQLNADPKMRGRVMSLYSVVFLGSTPIGAPLAGWIAEHLGPRVALGAGGIIAVAASIVAVRVVRRRPLADRPVADPERIPRGERAPEPAEPWRTPAEPWRTHTEPWRTPADAADPDSAERTMTA
jgi:MFS family permease